MLLEASRRRRSADPRNGGADVGRGGRRKARSLGWPPCWPTATPTCATMRRTRLAARGDARAIPVLADMLDPDETAGVDLEQDEEACGPTSGR